MPGGGMNHALAGRWKSLILVSVPGLILCLGLAVQSSTFLNHDVAWVLYSSRWVFDGAVFGRDIVAANPPLIWWISLLPSRHKGYEGWRCVHCTNSTATTLARMGSDLTSRLVAEMETAGEWDVVDDMSIATRSLETRDRPRPCGWIAHGMDDAK